MRVLISSVGEVTGYSAWRRDKIRLCPKATRRKVNFQVGIRCVRISFLPSNSWKFIVASSGIPLGKKLAYPRFTSSQIFCNVMQKGPPSLPPKQETVMSPSETQLEKLLRLQFLAWRINSWPATGVGRIWWRVRLPHTSPVPKPKYTKVKVPST